MPVLARATAILAVASGIALGGLMSASTTGSRRATGQAYEETETADLSTSFFSPVPEGSVAHSFLECIGELE